MDNSKLEAIDDEFLEAISGGSLEETQELLDWCNRHGAGITRKADNPDVGSSIFYFLVTTYPELRLEYANFKGGTLPNNIGGMNHEAFMNRLISKYGA